MTRMPHTPASSQVHPESVEVDGSEVVLGVDTHKERHVAAVISELGTLLGAASFPTTACGYQSLRAGRGRRSQPGRQGSASTGSHLRSRCERPPPMFQQSKPGSDARGGLTHRRGA